MNSIVRCPRTGRARSEGACRERHWCRQLFERGLSHRGLPLKRKFRPRCCAKTRAGVPCIMRLVPGKRRCRFHGGLSKTKAGRARIAEVQRRRWKAFRGVARLSQIPSKPEHGRTIPLPDIDAWSARPSPLIDCVINSLALAPNRLMSSSTMRKWILRRCRSTSKGRATLSNRTADSISAIRV